MAKQRIALVTVWFPPNNGVAVNRMQAFARYLGEDFYVEVFTLGDQHKSEERDFGDVHYLRAASIWKKIAHRTSDFKLLHHSKTVLKIALTKMGLSPYKSWKKQAVKCLENRHREDPFSLIISSYAPVDAHEVALEVVQKFPEIKWITDMRDEMGSNPFLLEQDREKLRNKELAFLPHVTALTTIALPILEDFKRVMPDLQAYVEVRNGFDHSVLPRDNFNTKFTMVYAGTFYGKRKPDTLFTAIESLLKAGKIDRDFCFRFIGTNHNFHIPPSLTEFVEFVPKTPYLEAIEMMANADCNLLINPPLGTKGQFSGKIFDYISVEKPILALVDLKDVAAELILHHHAGIPVEFTDIEGAEKAILELYGFWKRREKYPIDTEKTPELHRKFQVEKLKQLIHQLLAS